MKYIPFTEYVLPDGRMRITPVIYPDELDSVYQELKSSGCRFEMEWLRTGHCSLTIDKGYEFADEPIAFDVCKQITSDVITRLLSDAHHALQQVPYQKAASS